MLHTISNQRAPSFSHSFGPSISLVAAAGLPDPRDDHAIVIARFARDCLMKMQEVVNMLEISLG